MANEFYAICSTEAALTALNATNLLTNPHPCEYHEEYEIVGIAGDGTPIAVGFPWALWTYGGTPLSAAEWKELIDYVGDAAYALVYIKTRTNRISAGGKYIYSNFSAVMHRPEGDSIPWWRFGSVTIKFTKLVAL